MSTASHFRKDIDYQALQKRLTAAKNDVELFYAVVNVPFEVSKVAISYLSLGAIVLLLVNKQNGTIDRIAITDSEVAVRAKRLSTKRFEDIRIPVGYTKNAIARAIQSNQHQIVSDWQYLFIPELTPIEARFNQADSGIGCSVVYPLTNARDGGALIFSYFQYPSKITNEHHEFMRRYSEIVAGVL